MKKFIFILTIISFGAIAINTQSLFIREFLAIFSGSELTIGLLFSLWFIGIVFGAWLSGSVLKKYKIIIFSYRAILFLMSLLSITQIILIRLSRSLFQIEAGQYVPFEKSIIITFLIVFPFSFLIGFNFPIASQKWIEEISKGNIRNEAKIIGSVYLYESLGSVIAGSLLAFLLISKLQNIQIIFIWAFLNSLLSFLLLISEKGAIMKVEATLSFLFLLIIAFFLFSGIYKKLDYYTAEKRWKSIAGDIPFSKSIDTKYQNFSLGERENIIILYSNGEIAGTFPDPYTGAIEANLLMIQNPYAKNVLILGYGAENLLPEMLNYPLKKIDYVIIDPAYIEIVNKFFPRILANSLKNNKIKIFIEDGISYINHCKKKYDIIIVKQPDPMNANINRYYTFEFYNKLKKIMKKESILITFSASSPNYFSEESFNYVNSLYYTLKKAFPYVIITPGERATFFASQQKDLLTLDYNILAERYEKLNIKSIFFSKYHYQFLLEPERVSWIRNILSSKAQQGIINKEDKPSSFYLNLILWQKYSSRQLSSFLSKILKIDLFKLSLLILFIIFLFRIVMPLFIKNKQQRTRYDVLFAIFSIGFTGISLELLLLFAFQSHYGYLYQIISLLIALFMIGLVFGSSIGNKIISYAKFNYSRSFIICIFFLIIELIIFIKFYQILTKYIYGLLIMIAGLCSGLFFPISNKIYINQGASSEISASRTDSIDHLGACLGSIIIGCFLIPLLNIYETSMLLILLLLLAAFPFFVNSCKLSVFCTKFNSSNF